MTRLRQVARAAVLAAVVAALASQPAIGSPTAAATDPDPTGTTIDVGPTGWDIKRPVIGGACEAGCPWGELADFVRDAMSPLGYDTVVCRNCNHLLTPGLVSRHELTPPLRSDDLVVGTTERFDNQVDFGITDASFLWQAYNGIHYWAPGGPAQEAAPLTNLRLIANISDPMYVMAATKSDSGITSLAQAASLDRPLRILTDGEPTSQVVLDDAGLSEAAVEAKGGVYLRPQGPDDAPDEYDLFIDSKASPALNPESRIWTNLTQRDDLTFLDLPEATRTTLVQDFGLYEVTAKYSLLKGVDRPVRTVARSGEAIFAAADTPDADAYAVAQAVEQARSELQWYIRPYSYDSQAVWKDQNVPLHPGARAYYASRGYIAGGGATKAASTSRAKLRPRKVVARKTRAKLVVRIAAPGGSPSGRVLVTTAGRTYRGSLDSAGTATIRLRRFPMAGLYRVGITYPGDDDTNPYSTTLKVRVVRKE